jgi:predicted TIM-barrel fold metal-dependent hydrolase
MERSRGEVLGLCGRYGIDMIFLSTLWSEPYPTSEQIAEANGMTWGFMQSHPSLVRGMAYINPANGDFEREMRKCLGERKMSGVKLWIATLCDDPRVDPVAELAVEYGVPVLVHAFWKAVGQYPHESRAANVRRLAMRHPRLKILMAHLGANVYDSIKCVADCGNVFADFSGSLYRRDDLPYAVRHLGAERILYGSDMPSGVINCLGQVEGADLSAAERDAILSGNARRLFGLPD